jgi:MFS family permease
MVLGAGLGPLLSGIMAESLTQPVVPLFGTQLLILASAFVVVGLLPRRRIPARNREWRLRLPSVPKVNRLHLTLGIAVFAPGITSTSFILSLGPSLLKKLLDVSSPLVAGGMACLMFLSATGVQFLLKKLSVRSQFLMGTASVFLAMLCIAIAVYTSAVAPLVLAAMLAGIGQGLGQLGGLTLISLHVPEYRRAEANAVLNIGGYIPAAILPVCTGYLIDYTGLATGATTFAAILAAASIAAAKFVREKIREGE